MTLLDELIEEVIVLNTLVGKAFIKSEEVGSGDTLGDSPAEGARNLVDFHIGTLELKRLASDLHRIAEDLVTAAFNSGQHTVDGSSFAVRRAYKRTEWEHAKLATHVALRATGGELVDGMPEVIDAIVKACNPSWRVTVLKEMGLDDEEYCSRELGRATVTLL